MIPLLCLCACTGMLYKMRDRLGECVQGREEKQCTICLELIDRDFHACRFDKRHTFHKNCWKEWMKQRNACPICRQSQGMMIDSHGYEEFGNAMVPGGVVW